MNLTEVSAITRKLVMVALVLVATYLLGVNVYPTARLFFAETFPKKQDPIPSYGLLPPLEFKEYPITNSRIKIELNTPDGQLPFGLKRYLPVFEVIEPGFSYNAAAQAQADASTLGFYNQDLITDLNAETYKWRKNDTGSTLEINTTTRTLETITDYTQIAQYYDAGNITEEDAIDIAYEKLEAINRIGDALYVAGEQKVTLGKIDRTGKAVEVDAAYEAEFARVDFYRKMGDFPILGSDPKQGQLSLVVADEKNLSNSQAPIYVTNPNMKINYWEINEKTNSLYPLISVRTAWDALIKGNYVISNVTPDTQSPFEEYTPVNVDRVLINEIYLAFYDSDEPQKYLQPIFVFEGNYATQGGGEGSITFYVPAVNAEYVDTSSAQN